MPKLRNLQVGDESKLTPLFQLLTGKEILVDTAALLADNAVTCMVIEENEELLGFGALITHQVPTKGEVGRIEDVVIAENQQGKGLGKLLVLELIKVAKEKKIKQLNLTSNPMRVAAHKLYESVGFVKGSTDTFSMVL